MHELRKKLMAEPLPKNLQALIAKITPPKGVKRAQLKPSDAPPDEGLEMLDCEGDEIEEYEEADPNEDDDCIIVDDVAAGPR